MWCGRVWTVHEFSNKTCKTSSDVECYTLSDASNASFAKHHLRFAISQVMLSKCLVTRPDTSGSLLTECQLCPYTPL
jgi:hypothetical protein